MCPNPLPCFAHVHRSARIRSVTPCIEVKNSAPPGQSPIIPAVCRAAASLAPMFISHSAPPHGPVQTSAVQQETKRPAGKPSNVRFAPFPCPCAKVSGFLCNAPAQVATRQQRTNRRARQVARGYVSLDTEPGFFLMAGKIRAY